MTVLIICDPVDFHVSTIVWALEKYGIPAIQWNPAPPWDLAGAVSFDSGSVDYRLPAKGGEITPSSIDSVWMRRWPKPVFPTSFHENDRKASGYELLAYNKGLLELLPRGILWANPVANGSSADYKLRQLAAAISVGLPVPATIVTNDASEARKFVASHAEGEVIYKPFYAFHWRRADNEIYQSVTTVVAESDLDDPKALVWSPGIFQTFIPKAYELRVSIFGRTCVSAKIFDQDPIDWRTRQFDMKVLPYELPEAVEHKLHALMDELGLVMGMVDLIVTPEGDYVFLEVNEQGQFLWVEEMCPDLPLLDISARFFASGNRHFKYESLPNPELQLSRFLETNLEKCREEKERFLNAGGKMGSLLEDWDQKAGDRK